MESKTNHEYIKTVAALAKNNLPEMPHKTRKVPFSQTTQEILERRGKAAQASDTIAFDTLTKEFRKSKKRGIKGYVFDSMSKDLDVRDRWMRIRGIKKEYQPSPSHRKTAEGSHTPKHKIAEEAAKHLAQNQCLP